MESPAKPSESSSASELIISPEELKARFLSAKLDLSFTTQNDHQVLTLKVTIDGTGAHVDFHPQPRPAATFHQFRKFPVEIQKRVWELSFPEPRIFRLAENNGKSWAPVVVSHKTPGFAQACHFSRLVYKKEAMYALGSCGGPYKSLQVSPSRDVFYWDQDLDDWDPVCRYIRGLECFENIAVNLPKTRHDLQEILDVFIHESLPELKNLIFVLEHNIPPDTDVTFFDVDDRTTMVFDDEVIDWDEMQNQLQEILPFSRPTKPSFRVVEVARVRARQV
ncbi:hypothetical protein ACHAPO_001219 [Fusarium lateritium]